MLKYAGDDRDRFYAVWALARIDTDTGWLGLIDNLHHLDYSRVYPEALRMLVKAGERRAVPKLLRMMEVGISDYATMARALSQLGHTGFVEEMLELLRNPEPWERQVAAESLGGFGDERAVVPLIDALVDVDKEVRAFAARALGSLGDARSVQPLIEVLGDQDRYVLAEAVRSLGQLGDDRAVPHLSALLEDDDRDVRMAAQRALEKVANPSGRTDVGGRVGGL